MEKGKKWLFCDYLSKRFIRMVFGLLLKTNLEKFFGLKNPFFDKESKNGGWEGNGNFLTFYTTNQPL